MSMVSDQYGGKVETNKLVLLPDINLLDDNEIKVVVNADWYDVHLEDGSVFLCADFRAIQYLSDCGIEDCIVDNGLSEVMRVNDILKRWSIEDGFYHA